MDIETIRFANYSLTILLPLIRHSNTDMSNPLLERLHARIAIVEREKEDNQRPQLGEHKNRKQWRTPDDGGNVNMLFVGIHVRIRHFM
jgi:hypothetical protein